METAATVLALSAQARAAASEGRWSEAERLWTEVHRIDAKNPQALFSLGVHQLQRGRAAQAVQYFDLACALSPDDPFMKLTRAVAFRTLGDPVRELDAINAALGDDPYYLPALLAKGGWFERQGSKASAAMHYGVALRFAPPEHAWPAELRAQLIHAREVFSAHGIEIESSLLRVAHGLLQTLPEQQAGRWREAASIAAGKSQPYVSHCNQFLVPRLPAIPFFDPSDFPWVPALEQQTNNIRVELEALFRDAAEDFSPYVAYPFGAPVNQWRELNHSKRWSGFHLWRNGSPIEENLRRCPATARALAQVDLPRIEGLCPNVMFSALAPQTHIPPHTGETNVRAVAHLPLIVPSGCTYRVGYETRAWEVGQILIFDDTIEHEARNDGDAVRVVLLFDIWNPHLAPAERETARIMLEKLRATHA